MTRINPAISRYVDSEGVVDLKDYNKGRRKNKGRKAKSTESKEALDASDSRGSWHNKRARFNITGKLLKSRFRKQDGRCYYCGFRFYRRSSAELRLELERYKAIGTRIAKRNLPEFKRFSYHIEHLLPIARGGTNAKKNIVLACRDCNLEKFTMTEEEYQVFRQQKQENARAGTSKLDPPMA